MTLPRSVRLMSQLITVSEEAGLHGVCEPDQAEAGAEPGEDTAPHVHALYGHYSEAEQAIKLDQSLAFERQRETFLHENLHAMLSIGQLDALMAGSMEGFDEHLVSALAPILLSWMRDNQHAVTYLMEMQQWVRDGRG